MRSFQPQVANSRPAVGATCGGNPLPVTSEAVRGFSPVRACSLGTSHPASSMVLDPNRRSLSAIAAGVCGTAFQERTHVRSGGAATMAGPHADLRRAAAPESASSSAAVAPPPSSMSATLPAGSMGLQLQAQASVDRGVPQVTSYAPPLGPGEGYQQIDLSRLTSDSGQVSPLRARGLPSPTRTRSPWPCRAAGKDDGGGCEVLTQLPPPQGMFASGSVSAPSGITPLTGTPASTTPISDAAPGSRHLGTCSAPPERCESRNIRGILDPDASLPFVTQSRGCRVLTPPAPLPPALLALTQQHVQPQRQGVAGALTVAGAAQSTEAVAAADGVKSRKVLGGEASAPGAVAPVMSCSEASTAVPTASGSPAAHSALPSGLWATAERQMPSATAMTTAYMPLSARARAPLPSPPSRWCEQQDETATEAPLSPRSVTPLGSSDRCISGPALHVIQGLQAQLVQALGELREERREREELASTVRKLNERFDAKEAMATAAVLPGSEAHRLEESVATISEQVRSLQAEKERATGILRTLSAQQQTIFLRLEQQEQQIASDSHTPADVRLESASAELQTLRSEVAELASSMRVLHGMISVLASQDSVEVLQTEVGAIANVVSGFSERIDRLSGKDVQTRGHADSSLPSPARPQSALPEFDSASLRGMDASETAQVLRGRLAELAGDVQRSAVEKRRPEIPPAGEVPSALRQNPATRGAWQLPCAQAAATGRAAAEASVAANRSAPSPRRWMMEPLAVSVARTGPESWPPAVESI